MGAEVVRKGTKISVGIRDKKLWLELRAEVDKLCQERGSKKVLSLILGVPPSRLSKLLHGDHEPGAEVALTLKQWVESTKGGNGR